MDAKKGGRAADVAGWLDAGGSSVSDTLDGNKEFKTGFPMQNPCITISLLHKNPKTPSGAG